VKHKDLLIIFNIFGIQHVEDIQIKQYINSLRSLFWHLDRYPQKDRVRVVVGGCLISDKCAEALVQTYPGRLEVFKFPERYTCQIVTNKVALECEKRYKEEYGGYFYISSGLYFPKLENWNFFKRIDEHMANSKTGILQMQVNSDNGYHFLGFGPINWINEIDFKKDYVIPLGNCANFHAAIVHKRFRDFYGMPITDIHGLCGMESVLSYCCAAIGTNYILLGDSCLHHAARSDSGGASNLEGHAAIPCHFQLFGREKKDIASDSLAREVGIGYYPGNQAGNHVDWNGIILEHDLSKYDENYHALDTRNKEVAKKYFFSNKKELNYDKIHFEVIT